MAIFPHMCGFYQTLQQVQISGKNLTCVDKTTHMKVQVISGNSHTCLVFTKHMEVLKIVCDSHTCEVQQIKTPYQVERMDNLQVKILKGCLLTKKKPAEERPPPISTHG